MHLEIKQIEKHFGKKTILKNVTFDVETGDTIGIFGRNGCGKSTLMKILFGTMSADINSIFIDANPFSTKTNIARKTIAYLPQESFLPRDIKVRNLISMLFPDGEIQNQIFYSPGVSLFDNQWVGALSLGTLKYFEFLLLAHMDHPFLMLDEPFSMIDPLYHDIIKEKIISLKPSKGIIVTDHYYNNVWEVTNRNYVLVEGAMFQVETKADLSRFGYLPGESD
jgi:ABC-type multidrug transport system ATPase subunit